MGKPSYNMAACQKLSFEKFKEVHSWIDYFKWLTPEQWQAEYLTATGFDASCFENRHESVKVETRAKRQPKRGGH